VAQLLGDLEEIEMAQQNKKLSEQDLNQASELLLKQLPDHISQLIMTIKQEYDVELWHLICGILLEVYSEGRISAFQLDPQWLDGLRQTTLICQECKKIFTPEQINQKYCSNECGLKAEKISKALATSEPALITLKEVDNAKSNPKPESDISQPLHKLAAGSIDGGWTEILDEIK
jgi:hypothetical protein